MADKQELNNNTDTTNQGAEQQPAQQEEQGKGLIGGAIDGTTDLITNLWNWRIFFWEMLGTALFAHGICASDGNDYFVTLSLFAGILLVAPFSGGHLNPAVSFGFFIKDGIIAQQGTEKTVWRFKELLTRCLAQLAGACIGGATAFSLLGMSAAPQIPSDDFAMLGGYFTGEAFGTMMFVLTILIMTDNRTKLVDENAEERQNKTFVADNLTVVATIALALHFSRAFTYKTGGGLNPGIAVGLQIWFAIDEQTWEPLIHSWLFVFGPFLGAAIAAYYYSYFHLAATNDTGCFAPKPAVEENQEQQAGEAANNNQNQENKA